MYVFDLGADTCAQWLLSVGSTALYEDREAITFRGCAVGLFSVTCLGCLCPPPPREPVHRERHRRSGAFDTQ